MFKFFKPLAVITVLLLNATTTLHAQSVPPKTFTNPILPSGADPWIIHKDGHYYYTNTQGNRLSIWKTKNIADLANAEKKTVWTPTAGTLYSRNIWAPELHFLQNKWYMYFAADDGKNENHRLYVLENANPDPLKGEWTFKGKLAVEGDDKWAIDGSVFNFKGQLYLIWSGWEGDVNVQQNIYICKMKNPYTLEGKRVKLSSSDYDWEKHGDLNDPSNPPHVNVNEGPEVLVHNNKLFLIYSASGCWTDHYALGMLTASASSNVMDPASWKKSPKPVFEGSKQNSVYAPGHNSFFKSPDGKQDWILYHANPSPGCGCGGQRSPRMQQFTWTKDGIPDFGIPVSTGVALTVPSSK
ncbi:glycoside hydrolase family 43 protein [uncultured Mucilaginibacter sp.]|uniref:glycoside hydrolase family 43 protein n=1 Tax=uncultured Mucilaginibacter sp. TaxID=797541 RepID=UPI0025D53DB1|nr:glycoside hydrolase family 43 protein [uncultured Mucilaginibacter sp.]